VECQNFEADNLYSVTFEWPLGANEQLRIEATSNENGDLSFTSGPLGALETLPSEPGISVTVKKALPV
jgi:hypothetical protein